MDHRPATRLALLVLTLGLAPAAGAHEAAPAETPRRVSVSAQGEVGVVPDLARLAIGVTHLDADLKLAEKRVNDTSRALLAELRKLGLAEADIGSTGMNVQPEYVWDEKSRNNRLVGYRVSREVDLKIRDLGRLGDVLLAATRVGINQVQPPQLESSRAAELKREALAAAAAEAQRKAEVLARTLGVKLGPVRSLSANDHEPGPVPKMMVRAMAAEASFDSGNQEMGVSSGEIRYRASVQAEFDLLP
ncbi:MAG TPA: SIMPL domain-containing protein [Nevskiaceae bacterium]|nr:SIMPL domain-containing protein [Nevskiaceae bacterium]